MQSSQESEAKFAFFQSRNDKSLSPELLAKYHALYGFSFDDIRYYITFFGAVTTKTPSLNFEEFLPTASAFALSKKLYGAPLAAKNPMTLDLDSGVARFTSGSFTAIFIDRDDYIYLYTNVAAAVLHNGDVQISTDGCQMLITLEVPASDTALQPSASSSSSSSSAAFTEPVLNWKKDRLTIHLPAKVDIRCQIQPQRAANHPGWLVMQLKKMSQMPAINFACVKDEDED